MWLNQRIHRHIDFVLFASSRDGIVERERSWHHAFERSIWRMWLFDIAFLHQDFAITSN